MSAKRTVVARAALDHVAAAVGEDRSLPSPPPAGRRRARRASRRARPGRRTVVPGPPRSTSRPSPPRSVSAPSPPHRRSRLTMVAQLGHVADERVVARAAPEAVRALARPCSASLPALPKSRSKSGPPLTESLPPRARTTSRPASCRRSERHPVVPPRARSRPGAGPDDGSARCGGSRRPRPVMTPERDADLRRGPAAYTWARGPPPGCTVDALANSASSASCGARAACVAGRGGPRFLRIGTLPYCARARGRSSVG